MTAPSTGPRVPLRAAFTLIELLCVVAIIGLLASMIMPAVGTMKQKADSISCASNLRAIGVACQLYLQDHSFIYPCIEPVPTSSVYPANFQPTPYTSMVAAFGSYGVTQKTIQCPSDIKQPGGGSYAAYGSSYDWKPTLDDENTSEPLVYGRRMGFGAQTSGTSTAPGFVVKLSKVRQAFDDTQVHFGHMNALYADGHVVYFTTSTTSAH